MQKVNLIKNTLFYSSVFYCLYSCGINGNLENKNNNKSVKKSIACSNKLNANVTPQSFLPVIDSEKEISKSISISNENNKSQNFLLEQSSQKVEIEEQEKKLREEHEREEHEKKLREEQKNDNQDLDKKEEPKPTENKLNEKLLLFLSSEDLTKDMYSAFFQDIINNNIILLEHEREQVWQRLYNDIEKKNEECLVDFDIFLNYLKVKNIEIGVTDLVYMLEILIKLEEIKSKNNNTNLACKFIKENFDKLRSKFLKNDDIKMDMDGEVFWYLLVSKEPYALTLNDYKEILKLAKNVLEEGSEDFVKKLFFKSSNAIIVLANEEHKNIYKNISHELINGDKFFNYYSDHPKIFYDKDFILYVFSEIAEGRLKIYSNTSKLFLDFIISENVDIDPYILIKNLENNWRKDSEELQYNNIEIKEIAKIIEKKVINDSNFKISYESFKKIALYASKLNINADYLSPIINFVDINQEDIKDLFSNLQVNSKGTYSLVKILLDHFKKKGIEQKIEKCLEYLGLGNSNISYTSAIIEYMKAENLQLTNIKEILQDLVDNSENNNLNNELFKLYLANFSDLLVDDDYKNLFGNAIKKRKYIFAKNIVDLQKSIKYDFEDLLGKEIVFDIDIVSLCSSLFEIDNLFTLEKKKQIIDKILDMKNEELDNYESFLSNWSNILYLTYSSEPDNDTFELLNYFINKSLGLKKMGKTLDKILKNRLYSIIEKINIKDIIMSLVKQGETYSKEMFSVFLRNATDNKYGDNIDLKSLQDVIGLILDKKDPEKINQFLNIFFQNVKNEELKEKINIDEIEKYINKLENNDEKLKIMVNLFSLVKNKFTKIEVFPILDYCFDRQISYSSHGGSFIPNILNYIKFNTKNFIDNNIDSLINLLTKIKEIVSASTYSSISHDNIDSINSFISNNELANGSERIISLKSEIIAIIDRQNRLRAQQNYPQNNFNIKHSASQNNVNNNKDFKYAENILNALFSVNDQEKDIYIRNLNNYIAANQSIIQSTDIDKVKKEKEQNNEDLILTLKNILDDSNDNNLKKIDFQDIRNFVNDAFLSIESKKKQKRSALHLILLKYLEYCVSTEILLKIFSYAKYLYDKKDQSDVIKRKIENLLEAYLVENITANKLDQDILSKNKNDKEGYERAIAEFLSKVEDKFFEDKNPFSEKGSCMPGIESRGYILLINLVKIQNYEEITIKPIYNEFIINTIIEILLTNFIMKEFIDSYPEISNLDILNKRLKDFLSDKIPTENQILFEEKALEILYSTFKVWEEIEDNGESKWLQKAGKEVLEKYLNEKKND